MILHFALIPAGDQDDSRGHRPRYRDPKPIPTPKGRTGNLRCQDSSGAAWDTLGLWNRVAVRRDSFASVSDANLPGLAGLYEW